MPTGTVTLLKIKGFSKSLAQWAKELGLEIINNQYKIDNRYLY